MPGPCSRCGAGGLGHDPIMATPLGIDADDVPATDCFHCAIFYNVVLVLFVSPAPELRHCTFDAGLSGGLARFAANGNTRLFHPPSQPPLHRPKPLSPRAPAPRPATR